MLRIWLGRIFCKAPKPSDGRYSSRCVTLESSHAYTIQSLTTLHSVTSIRAQTCRFPGTIHQKSRGRNSWDLIYWTLLNYTEASSAVHKKAEAGWISTFQAVMSMNWESLLAHWIIFERPGSSIDSTVGTSTRVFRDDCNTELAVILYKTYTNYFCWLQHDISKVAGKSGHLLHGIQINNKKEGKHKKECTKRKQIMLFYSSGIV